jgi:hypothetical protein
MKKTAPAMTWRASGANPTRRIRIQKLYGGYKTRRRYRSSRVLDAMAVVLCTVPSGAHGARGGGVDDGGDGR